MMVKNENLIIRNALNSAVNIVNSYFICDTGSTDGTIETIKSHMKDLDIPGKIISIPWINFGVSKSQMMRLAHEHSSADFFLFFDAKETVVNTDNQVPTKKDRVQLEGFLTQTTADIFMLYTLFGVSRYRRWSMFRNNQVYVWKSPVHEYVDGDHILRTNLDILKIKVDSRGSSGNSSEKYMYYAQMLKEYIEDNGEAQCPRETYYLAQSYKDASRMDLAIEWYEKRIAFGDFAYNEEPFISMLALFRHYKTINTEKTLYYLFQMKEHYPYRLEGSHEGMLYFKDKDWNLAFAFGKSGYDHFESQKGYLFLTQAVYDYQFLFEFALVAHYSGHHTLAIKTAYQLKDKEMPEHLRNTHNTNTKYYLKEAC